MNQFQSIDFSGVDMGGIDLSGVELPGSEALEDMEGISFEGVDMDGIDLSGIDGFGPSSPDMALDDSKDSMGQASLKAIKNVPEGWQQQYGGLAKMLGEDMGQGMERNFAIAAHRVSQQEGMSVDPQHIKAIYLANKEGLIDRSAPFSEQYKLADELVNSGSVSSEAVQDAMPLSPAAITNYGQGIIDKAESEKDQINVDPHSKEYYASSIVGSLGNMGPALLAGIATRNPNVTMGLIGPQVTGQAYDQARQDGADIGDAQLYAVASAAAEAIPEKMALHQILKAGKGLFRKIGVGAAAEGIQEMVTEAINIGLDSGILDQDMTWGEAGMRLVDAGIIGSGSGAVIGSVVEGVDEIVNREARQAERRAKPAEKDLFASEQPQDTGLEVEKALSPDLNGIDLTGLEPQVIESLEADTAARTAIGPINIDELPKEASIQDEISALEKLVAEDQAANIERDRLAEQERQQQEDAAWQQLRAQEAGALTTPESKAAGESEVAWRERQRAAQEESARQPDEYEYEADAGRAELAYLSKRLEGKADNLRAKLEQRRQPPANSSMATALSGAMEQAGTTPKEIGKQSFADMLVRRQHDSAQHLKPAITRPDRNRIMPERDELMTAIRKLGGLNIDEARAQGIDPAHFREKVGINNPFRRNGRSVDDLAESLRQYGYATPDANSLLNLIDESLRGRSQYTPEGAVTAAEQQEREDAAMRALDDNDPTPPSAAYDPEVESFPEVTEQDKVLAHLVDRALDEGVDPQKINALKAENLNHNKAAGKLLALTYEAQQNGRQSSELGSRQGARPGDQAQAGEGQVPFQEQDEGYNQGPDLAQFFGLADEVTNSDFSLEQQTEESLAADAKNRTPEAVAAADQKSQIDREREHFTLTGSESANTSVSASNDATQAKPSGDMFTPTRGISPSELKQSEIDAKANEAATSPTNEDSLPTEAQKAAGNYKKGRIDFQGLKIAVENPKGSVRSGTDPGGQRWENKIHHHYGDLTGTKGADGDPLDVFVGPDLGSQKVFVIDQVSEDGTFDEHKIMLGFDSKLKAREGYRKNYSKGWRVGPTTTMTMEEFKQWLREGDTTKPAAPKGKAAAQLAAKPTDSATPIEDAGEKLGGARKDELRTVRERLGDMGDEAIASSKLSELWPKGEVDRITDPFHAAAYHAVRGLIPTKPRAAYRVKRWVDQVKSARELLGELSELGAESSVARMREHSPGLNILADQIELLMGIDRSHWGRVSDAKIRSGRYNRDGEMVPGSWVELKIDKRGKSFYGHDSIASALPAIKSSLDSKAAPEKKLKFNIYTRTHTGEVFISAGADKESRPLKLFETTGEARKYLNDNHDDLVAAWEAVKNRDNVTKADMRRGVNEARVGQDYRGGKDVTPEQFLNQFGFRGVEFGNWVKQGNSGRERQGILNDAYDAFMDLAGVIGVPPRALSLEGRLGVGFGSRGRGGSAAAHYEPGRMVINLTKTKGAGSLAHEWFHAADNYFSRKREAPVSSQGASTIDEAYITYRPEAMLVNKKHPSMRMTRAELSRYQASHPDAPLYAEGSWERDANHPKGVRPEVEKAFAELVATLNASPMLQRSKVIDGNRSDGYWSRVIERGARAFETYTIARLADQGARNDYLANVQTLEEFARDPGRYPYLTSSEQGPVNEAFDKLFSTIETRETGAGLALYSIGSGKGVSVKQAERAISKLVEEVGVPAEVVLSEADLPQQNYDEIRRDGLEGQVQGIYNTRTGKVYIVASNLDSKESAAEVYLHEVVGHKGIRAALGRRLDLVLPQIYKSIPPAARKMLEEAYSGQLEGASPAEFKRIVAEEYVAHIAETDPKNSALKAVISAIRDWLRRVVPSLKWTDADIVRLLAQGKKKLRSGERADGLQMDEESASSLLEMLQSIDLPDAREAIRSAGGERSDASPDTRFSLTGKHRYAVKPETAKAAATKLGIFAWNGDTKFTVPEERLGGRLIRMFQDKYLPLKATQSAIEDASGPLSDSENAYMAEELFHGKTEEDLRKLEEQLVQPLVDQLVKSRLNMDELDLYLVAKHAPERNRYIASINPEMPDGGSGMTNAQAAKVLAQVKAEGKESDYQAAAEKVYTITQRRRDLMRESGLQDDLLTDAWESMYEFYVPLKGFALDEQASVKSSRPRVGSGFDIRGKESMRAMGRRTMAESPTTHAIKDLTESIIRNRKNEVGQTFLRMVQNNPNKDYWEIFTSGRPDTGPRIVSTRTGDEVRTMPLPMHMLKDDYLAVKRDGQEYFIKIKDPRLMVAMKNLGPETMSGLVRGLGTVTRFLSAVNTSYNPEFMISNMSRDIQTALYNALAEQEIVKGKVKGQELAVDMLKGVPKSIRAIWASSRGKILSGDAGEIQSYYQEFLEDGAKTGYFDSQDVDGIASDLAGMVAMAQGGAKGNLLKYKKKVGDFVEHGNSAIENGIRLSAYMEARKAGISRAKAASFSKNLTVNFNRKGEVGATMNSIYMFANASVQGTANFARAMANFKEVEDSLPIIGKKRLNLAQKMAGTMIAAGFMLSLFNRWMADEDDDGVNWYDKVPGYVRERNLVIMKPGGEGKFWTIPLPYGYNVFYNLGDTIESAMNSEYQPRREDLVTDLLMSVIGSFSPLGAHGGDFGEALTLTFTPTVMLPFLEVNMNTNFFGGNIYKENYPGGPQKADSAMSMRSTKDTYKVIAGWLNDVTGGSDYRPGLVDISPDTIEHLAEFSLGGLYKLVDRTIDSTGKAIQGREVETSNIPFWRKVSGEVRPFADASNFYDSQQEIKNLEAELKTLRGAERKAFRDEYLPKLRMSGQAKFTSKQLGNLRDQRDRIEADESLTARERDEKLKTIEAKMKVVVDRFNRKWGEIADK